MDAVGGTNRDLERLTDRIGVMAPRLIWMEEARRRRA
jgi:hypothetical protein